MTFLNPLAFIGLISIPAIIAMYMLKQKQKQVDVSSLFLWRMAAESVRSETSLQKLRKDLLMLLQICAAALLVLALAVPSLKLAQKSGRVLLVLDASFSMQTMEERENRFEIARREIRSVIQGMPDGSQISLIVAGREPYAAISFSEDKSAVLNRLNSISPTYSYSDKAAVEDLIKNLLRRGDAEVIVFSDEAYDLGDMSYENRIIGLSKPNMAVTAVSHTVESDGIVVLTRVRNNSEDASQNELALYADDRLIEIKQLNLVAGEEKTVYFTGIPVGSEVLSAQLSVNDSLIADDVFYDVVSESETRKVMLFTERNIFLQNILSLMPNTEVYKGDISAMEEVSGYYLYVFDGVMPDKLPVDGHILAINPPQGNPLLSTGDEAEVNMVYPADSSLLSFINDFSFLVSRTKVIEQPDYTGVVLDSDAGPLVVAGENNGKRIMVIGFDLHNSDLPLKKEFPVFMYNIYNWFAPGGVASSGRIEAGDAVFLNILPDCTQAEIIAPDGSISSISGGSAYNAAVLPGMYTLKQETPERTVYSNFVVNPNTSEESMLLRDIAELTGTGTEGVQALNGSMNVTKWVLTLLLLLLAVEGWVYYRHGRHIYTGNFHKTVIYGIRAVSVALILMAMLGVRFPGYSHETTTVFTADLSDSMRNGITDISGFIRGSMEYKEAEDLSGIVCFGENAYIESIPTQEDLSAELNTLVQGGFTNIADGLRISASLLPENTRKRIVLLSDGAENIGNAEETAKLLKEAGIRLDVFPIEVESSGEVQLSGIMIPKSLSININYDIEVKLYSTINTQGRLLVYRNNTAVINEEVDITKGSNTYVFSDYLEQGGGITYRAEVQPRSDTYSQNNTAHAYRYAEDVPKVLVVDFDGSASEITKILDGESADVTVMAAGALSENMAVLNGYDAVILADISIEDMPERFPQSLESYVKNTGGGLLVTGGENSFALGGYHQTPLEAMLPVEMELKNDEQAPNLGLIIVLDRSGSMSGGRYGLSKLSLAKEAAARAVTSLHQNDFIGVIAFDDAAGWAVAYQRIGENAEAIESAVHSITEGGGTSILPALQEAYTTMSSSFDTKLQHIILLTDGQAEQTGYDGLLEAMEREGITLSTVAVGSDADISLLEKLAERGRGRYYFSDEFTDLPKIFLKETFLAGKEYLNNRSFFPEVNDYSPVLNGVERVSVLDGYTSTTVKPRADAILVSDTGEPVLAAWQYGLGRTVAFTSDMKGRWTSDWLQSDESGLILRNAVSWVLRKQESDDIGIDVETRGKTAVITLSAAYSSDIEAITAQVMDADGMAVSVEFQADAPGMYKAVMNGVKPGVYVADIELQKVTGTEHTVKGISIPYSAEFDLLKAGKSRDLLLRLAQITGGRVLSHPEEVFQKIDDVIITYKDLTRLILIVALIVFLLDVAYRRFSFMGLWLESAFGRAASLSIAGKTREKPPKKEKVKKEVSKKVKEETVQNGDKETSTSARLLSQKKKRSGTE